MCIKHARDKWEKDFKSLVGKHEDKGPSEQFRRSLEENSKLDHNRVWGRELNTAGSYQSPRGARSENDNEPTGSIDGGEILQQLSDYKLITSILLHWALS
jgi:hypothetical protein